MICPLCAMEKSEFHKKSHIVPEWMYKALYDDKHTMVNVEFDNDLVNRKQKGYYEEYIICIDCEKESQLYDSYAGRILTDRAPETKEHRAVTKKLCDETRGGKINRLCHWENVDFLKFQKFAFATVLKGHLGDVKHGKTLLGKKHFEQIRQLYKNSVINDRIYPITVVQFPDDAKLKNQALPPFANMKNGHRFVEFAGAGFHFQVYVSSHPKPPAVYFSALKSNGSMYVLHAYFEESGTFKNMESPLAALMVKFPKL